MPIYKVYVHANDESSQLSHRLILQSPINDLFLLVLAAQNSNITVIMDIPYAYILSLLNTKNIKTSPLNKLLYIMLIWEIL